MNSSNQDLSNFFFVKHAGGALDSKLEISLFRILFAVPGLSIIPFSSERTMAWKVPNAFSNSLYQTLLRCYAKFYLDLFNVLKANLFFKKKVPNKLINLSKQKQKNQITLRVKIQKVISPQPFSIKGADITSLLEE